MLNLSRTSTASRPLPDSVFKTSAFDNSAGAMMTVDRDLRILHANEATCKLLRDNEAATFAIVSFQLYCSCLRLSQRGRQGGGSLSH